MLTRVLRTISLDTIDRRSSAGVYMRRLRQELTDQLGGDPSPAESILIEEAAKTALIAKAVGDRQVARWKSPAGGLRKSRVLPVLTFRTNLLG